MQKTDVTNTAAQKLSDELKSQLRRDGLTVADYLALPPNKAFKVWLKAQGLTYVSFAAKVGVPYNTVFHWGQKRRPTHMALSLVGQHFTDCPLVCAYAGDGK